MLFGAVLEEAGVTVRGLDVDVVSGLVSALVSVEVAAGFFGCVAGPEEDVVDPEVVEDDPLGFEEPDVDDDLPRLVFVLELPPPVRPVCAKVTVSVCEAEPLLFCAITWMEFDPEFRLAVKLSMCVIPL